MFHRPKSEEDDTQQPVKEENTMSASQSTESKPSESNNQQEQQRSIGIPGSGLSRLGQQAPRMPSGYAPYGSAPYSSTSSQAAAPAKDSGRKLIVGTGISLSGEIEACDHLIVEGKIEAALKAAKLLEIAESGTFFGTVDIEEATVAGTFEGDLKVTGRLTVLSTGSITGAISYGELSIEAGATIDGKLSPLNSGAAKRSAPKSTKKETSVQSYQQQVENVPAEQEKGNELFTEERVAAAQ